MNLLFAPEQWSGGGSIPPIYWNTSEQRYEVLVASSAGVSGLLLEMIEGASAGDTIEFTYDVDGFFTTEPGGASDYTFRLVRTGSEEVLWSVQMSDAPVSGEVSVDCEEGAQYQFEVYRDGGFGFTLYDFEAIITPTGSPEPAACFWTDIVNATQECGEDPDPAPSWIPIHTSDVWYSLSANSEGTSMVDSTIITDIAFGDCNWALHFGTPEPPGGRVRVTVNITSVTGENSLLLFQYTLGSGSNDGVVMNEHPDSTTFEPSTFVVEIVPNGEQFYLQLTAFDTTGLTATYFIEIEG